MTFRPIKVEQMYFVNRQKINFMWETDYGLATSFESVQKVISQQESLCMRKWMVRWLTNCV